MKTISNTITHHRRLRGGGLLVISGLLMPDGGIRVCSVTFQPAQQRRAA